MSYVPAVQIITQKIIGPGNSLIEYPVVVGMVNTTVQKKINEAIVFVVNKLYVDQVNQLLYVQGYPQIPPMEIRGSYEIKTNERSVLSLSISNYTIAYPAAHGWTMMKSLTFDVQTGRIYQLYDLFKPESDYAKKLSDLISIQIKERNIPLIEPYPGIKPDNQDYYIADKCLVIYYQLVEFTPYVYGFPMFPISVYEIQDMIKEDSPLYKMIPD